MLTLLAAVVQMTSTAEVERNLDRAAQLCARARARGADLVVLPENFALLTPSEEEKLSYAEDLEGGGRGGILRRMQQVARTHGLHLFLGGLPERGPDPTRVYNTCIYLRPDGTIGAVYRKIHLFDVDLADGTVLRESARVAGGDPEQEGLAETPWGVVGLSICYDVRFPELYRRLVRRGARMLIVPSAFTLHTGKDHWHLLVRARAIENQCYVLAAAQQGRHGGNRTSYGHSLIVDPWGTVLVDCPDGEGVAVAELDMGRLERIRQELPALRHRRIF
ncbi:MAG: carbon-nitrogen hydrolase family protein [Myxococcales bacterium]|nr:carbon-nitrogen hydrolase family protein [Myxococcota bacterium]MDW8282138.1 carbon-nitrogen hydrolase family protein [Myxococcales bacterium]